MDDPNNDPNADTSTNPNNTRQALAIVGGGAAGGALSFLFTLAGGGHLGNLTPVPAVLISIILGAGSGFIGVYVFFYSMRKEAVRCLAFAVLCGFGWRVVYEAGTSMLSKRQASTEADAGSTKTADLAQEVKTSTAAPEQAKAKVVALAAAASDSLNAASKSEDPQVKEKAAQASTKALEAIATTTQPDAAESVAHIATAAVLNGQPDIALRAVNDLKRGPLTPAKTHALLQIETIARQKGTISVTEAAKAKQ
jgi:hypothetical protein